MFTPGPQPEQEGAMPEKVGEPAEAALRNARREIGLKGGGDGARRRAADTRRT
ncbi:hypothetical protein AB0C06_00275 [Micromonospora inaquosa]|uniref:hypothetical protein n=1 Tax=Micromonospora inaquosa TaxID=2203716 RepID=UPI0033DEE7F2